MYKPQIYIEKIDLLHVITYDWKYINVVNLGNFFCAELRINNGKNLIGKSWNINSVKWTKVVILEWEDTMEFLLLSNVVFLRYFFQQRQFCQLQPNTIVLPVQWVP